MAKSLPVQTGDEEYKVIVEHPAIRQAFESEMAGLMEYLRSRLKNDALVLKVEIDESKEILKQLPPQEMLKNMIENNAPLAEFISSIDAELI